MATPSLGAELTPTGTRFALWSTRARRAAVVLFDENGERSRVAPMTAQGGGLFETFAPDVGAGARYQFELDDRVLPDPYARFFPRGGHGPAVVVDPVYPWRYSTRRTDLASGLVIYELHVGTFTAAGTYAAAQARLAEIAELGVNAVEIMPLSSFAGRWGWGYDGVAHFAPHASYGTPVELCAFIDTAHSLGLAVLLDVVYNHFGPDGNYLAAYSPEYFTSRHKTPWGDAPDYAEQHMRRLVLDNVRHWLGDYRFDGLRLDAVHAIVDDSPQHIVREIAEVAHGIAGRPVVIAEDERRSPTLVTELGLDGFWEDAFHHHVHVLLTGEDDGYYARYKGGVAELAAVVNADARSHTRPIDPPRGPALHTELRCEQLVYCLQNHDQVGNRALGERLHHLVDLEAYEAVSTLLLFLPMTPLLFMGQEWAASAPFLYFTDHDPALGKAVSRGRREEFKAFGAFADPAARDRIPDPQVEDTYRRSQLDWTERTREPHAAVLALYRRLLSLRLTDAVLADTHQVGLLAGAAGDVLWVRREGRGSERVCLVNFGADRSWRELEFPGANRLATRDLVTGSELVTLRRHQAVILTPADPSQR